MRDRQVIKDDGAKIEKLILEVLLDIRGLLAPTLVTSEPIGEKPKEVKPKKRKKRKIKTV